MVLYKSNPYLGHDNNTEKIHSWNKSDKSYFKVTDNNIHSRHIQILKHKVVNQLHEIYWSALL